MHYALAVQTLTAALNTAERLGATIPKPLAADHARLVDLMAKARTLAVETPSDFPEAVVASLEAGNDPATDPAVLAALVRRTVVESTGAIQATAGDRATALIVDNATAILECFREPFDAAAEKIDRAAGLLGDIDLDDSGAVGRLGPEAAAAWAEARAAEQVIADVQRIRATLAAAAPELSVNPQYRVLAIADVPAARFFEDQLRNANVTPWQAARRGYPLSLAMPDELDERIAAALVEMERRNTRAANGYRDEYRRQHGVVTA